MYASYRVAERQPVVKRIIRAETNTDTSKPLRDVPDRSGHRTWRVPKVQHRNLGDLLVGKPKAEVREGRSSEETGQCPRSEGPSVKKGRREWMLGKDVVEETHKRGGHLLDEVERGNRPGTSRTGRRTNRETMLSTTGESGTAIREPSIEGSPTRGAGRGKSARPEWACRGWP